MYYLIGVDGREYGPFTPEQIRQWIADGRANSYSRIRRDGETTWQALGGVAEFADATRPKPMPEPGTPPPPLNAEAIAAEYLGRHRAIDIGSAIQRGWALVRDNPGPLIGGSLLFMFVSIGVALIPFVGWLASVLIGGPLAGGLYYVFIRRIRGEQAGAGEVFAGFNIAYLNLLLVNIVSTLLVACGTVLCILPGIYLAVAYVFALPLVIDKRMEFWTAMEVSRRVVHHYWWSMLGFVIIAALIILAGVLACIIGVIVAAPVATASMMYLYQDLFGEN